MAGSGQNFLSVLNDEKIGIFCAYDRDYGPFRGEIFEGNLFENLGLGGIKKCVFMNQIHSRIVTIDAGKNSSCDGLITRQKGTALCVLSADCLPLLLWHKDGLVAALHSGRQGCFENILAACAAEVEKFYPELKMANFKLFIMPAICQRHYELGGEILEHAGAHFGEFLRENRLDLKALVKKQAQNLGMEDIVDLELCTFEDGSLPSYRRDKTQRRFVSVIVLKG